MKLDENVSRSARVRAVRLIRVILAALLTFVLLVPGTAASAATLTLRDGSQVNLAYTYPGTITTSSCSNPARGDPGFYANLYKVSSSGPVSLYMKEGPQGGTGISDPYLQVLTSDRRDALYSNDDAGGDDNGDGLSYSSYLGSVSIGTENYIAATTIGSGQTGSYTLYSSVPLTAVTTCPQVITFQPQSSATYGSAFSVSASTNLGLTVSVTTSTPTICTVSGSSPFTITPINIGTCTLTAQQSGGSGAEAAQPVTAQVLIGQRPLSVSGLSVASKNYDGTATASISGTAALVGVVGSDQVSLSGVPSGSFASSNAGTQSVTVSGLSLVGTASGRYSLSAISLSGTINKIGQGLTWNPTTNYRPSQSGVAINSATTTTGTTVTYSVVSAGTTGCTVSAGKLSLLDVGQCVVRATAASSTNYNLETIDRTFTITRLSQTMTWNPVTTFTPGQTGVVFSGPTAATATGDSTISYEIVSAGTAGCTVTGSTLRFTAEGTCSVRATALTSPDYSSVSQTATFTIARLSQTIAWTPETNYTPGQTGVIFSGSTAATASGDSTISYEIVSAGTAGCSITGSTLSFTAEGSCSVRATALTSPNYNSVSQTATITVARLEQSISWTPVTTYLPAESGVVFADGTAATATGDSTISYQVVNAGTTGCAITGATLTFTEEGTCQLRATALVSPNYNSVSQTATITIRRLSQVVSWNPAVTLTPADSGESFVPAVATGTTAIGYVVTDPGDTACSIQGNTLTFSAEGSCVVRATAAQNGTYSSDSTDVTFTIARLAQTILWTPSTILIPSDSGLEFERAVASGDSTITYSVSNAGTTGCAVNGDSLTFTGEGNCTVRAFAAQTLTYNDVATTVTFRISKLNQVITWSPILEFLFSEIGYALAAPESTGDGAISLVVTDPGSAQCSIVGFTLSVLGIGSCEIQALAASSVDFNVATLSTVFEIGRRSQSVLWAPTNLSATADVGTITPNQLARSTQSATIGYSVANAGTTGCAVNPTTGAVSFSAAGVCVVRATAAQTATELEAAAEVSFQILPAVPRLIQTSLPDQPNLFAPPQVPSAGNLVTPVTLGNGEIPRLASGASTMLINGVETAVEIELVAQNQLRATTPDGMAFNLQIAGPVNEANRITDSNGSVILRSGSNFSLSVAGLAPESSYVVWIFSTPRKLLSGTADSSGAVSAEVLTPSGLEAGQHTLQIAGVHPDGSTRAFMISVVVPEASTNATDAEQGERDALRQAGPPVAAALLVFALVAGAITFWRKRRRV